MSRRELPPLSQLHIQPVEAQGSCLDTDRHIASAHQGPFEDDVSTPTVSMFSDPRLTFNSANHSHRNEDSQHVRRKQVLRSEMKIPSNVFEYAGVTSTNSMAQIDLQTSPPGIRPSFSTPVQSSWIHGDTPSTVKEFSPGNHGESEGGFTTPRQNLPRASSTPESTPTLRSSNYGRADVPHQRALNATPQPPRQSQLSPPVAGSLTPAQLRSPVIDSGSPEPRKHYSTPTTVMQGPSQVLSPGLSLHGESPTTALSWDIRKPSRLSKDMTPSRILNADGLQTDTCTQCLSWRSGTPLFIALHDSVYAWTPSASKLVFRVTGTFTTAVAAVRKDHVIHLIIGCDNGLLYMLTLSAVHGDEFVASPSNPVIGYHTVSEHLTRIVTVDVCGDRMLSVSRDGFVMIADLKSINPPLRLHLTRAIPEIGNVNVARFNREGATIAFGTTAGLVLQDSFLSKEPTFLPTPAPVECVCWSPHTVLSTVAFTFGSTVRFYAPGTGDKGWKDLKAKIASLLWSRTTDELVVSHGQLDPTVIDRDLEYAIGVYDVSSTMEDGSIRLRRMIAGHRSEAVHLTLSPDFATLVSGAGQRDSTLRFWELFPSADPEYRLAAKGRHGGSLADPMGRAFQFDLR
jgi:hypothetical protein